MNILNVIENKSVIFTEGAIAERVRKEFSIPINPFVAHSVIIYDPESRKLLRNIYKQYIATVRTRNSPILIFTPTRRANPERINQAGMSNMNINGDCTKFLKDIRDEYDNYSSSIFIGGIMGCKGDAYKAEQALETNEAFEFHLTQAKQLSDGGVDFLFGATLPATSEAIGLAMAMEKTGKPYVLSFVVRPNGTLLDGIPIHNAIEKIDGAVLTKPLFYMVNCVHPSVLVSALTKEINCSDLVKQRLIGIQANTSSQSPEELDDSSETIVEDTETLIVDMLKLRNQHHLRIFGGCCGTDNQHIHQLVERIY